MRQRNVAQIARMEHFSRKARWERRKQWKASTQDRDEMTHEINFGSLYVTPATAG